MLLGIRLDAGKNIFVTAFTDETTANGGFETLHSLYFIDNQHFNIDVFRGITEWQPLKSKNL
jgi:hypothetical protein